ncbi:MAG: hypothetical protein COW00_00565 [Bdellovibrio sp. CG12_big_fil_rev_8_21_14_0_65_39_13]|nr:MAG: hypothetical protein COW78_04505 [Bdellovibrio sp. CG22_combo_CG10-13_8_21_14_all_39_27]PIQ62976.1 MAG: hypothetical protein COW00_00565 [Bdellovibrio sp. CG12_big_fil_rev_8_21_14_0_65_39_13]PIR32651.1 MAG: hypothetical protein COV37_19055 [Bdellovibrio sp. CG11_big_fil_rev_8_21_14_0_20_39_38]
MNQRSFGHFLYEANIKFHRTLLGAKVAKSLGNDQYEGLHYMETGNPDGPILIYIHGFGDNKDGFLWPAMLLKKYRVLMPDLPGFGDNPQNWQRNYSMDYSKACLWNWIEELDLGPCHVAGNSLGGALSIKLCLEHPEHFKTLTLIDSAGFYYPHIPSLLHEYADGINLFQVTDEQTYQKLLAKLVHQPHKIPKPVARYLYQRIKSNHDWFGKMMNDLVGKDIDVNDPAVIAERSFNEKIKKLKQPVLILWGDCDGIFPVEIAETIHQSIPKSEKYIFKKTGHAPQFEHPVKIAQLLNRFMKTNLTTDKAKQ